MENSSDSPAWAENNRKKTQIIDSDNRTPFFHYISSPWIACFAVLLVCLGLYTRYNAFPPFYHVDEKRKVVYVQKGESNFYHPMLLMETSRCAARIFHAKNRDDIHVIGRDVSAWFAALSVIALLGVAFVHGGTVAAWTAGLFTALCSLLLTCAHYMKEDTALLFGLAFTCLALTLFLEKPQRRYQVLLAIACATVVSGKYVGAVVLFFALPLLFLPPRQDARDRWSSRLSWFLLPFLLTVMCINHAIIQHPAEFIEGLSYEASHVVTGHKGLAGVPFAQQDFDILIHQTPWPICLLAALYFVFFALTWRKRKVSEKVMALFPIGYFSILLLSEIQFSRYLLPVVVWLHFLAGMSLVELVRFLPWGGRSRAFIGIFLFAGILGLLGLRCGNFLDQFAHDSRERAARWATANLPRNAVVLEDNDVELKSFQTWGRSPVQIPFSVTDMKWAADIGTVDEARRQGFTHVAISDMAYGRFFEKHFRVVKGYEEVIGQRRAFYSDLFGKEKSIWSAVPSIPMDAYTNPTIYLFEIAPVVEHQPKVSKR